MIIERYLKPQEALFLIYKMMILQTKNGGNSMSNLYQELKQKQEERVNQFPMKFAFSNSQFEKAMEELGLTKDDKDKITGIGNGGFIRTSDKDAFGKMMEDIDEEMKRAIEGDKTGEGFIADMFEYELNNHEYVITYDSTDAIYALGLTKEEVLNNPLLTKGLKLAKNKVLDWYEKNS